jgi:hypothetical protein
MGSAEVETEAVIYVNRFNVVIVLHLKYYAG